VDSDEYRSTRAAWARIWSQEADLQRELATLEYPRSRELRLLYRPYLPSGELILEAGCGMGIELVSLARSGRRVVGIDYVEQALHPLKAIDNQQMLTAGDIHRLPYKQGAFGGYLSLGVLEHFPFGPLPGLKEANRVLRMGGIIVVSVPYPNPVWRLAQAVKRARTREREADPGYYETAYTPAQLQALLSRTGFERIEHHPVGHSFTLWQLGWPFRARGYYRTTQLTEWIARLLRIIAPWWMCFECLVIARKVSEPSTPDETPTASDSIPHPGKAGPGKYP